MITQKFNWTIAQVERKASNGFVTAIHWRYSLTDDCDTVETYSVQSYSDEPEDFVPFEKITEEQVIKWLETSLDMEELNASLIDQLEEKKKPSILCGMPWDCNEKNH